MNKSEFERRQRKGDISKNRIFIQSNVFNIPEELKGLDSDFFVCFNIKDQNYELHHERQAGNTYCLTFPFNELDGRAVEYTRKNLYERNKDLDIVKEIEKHNAAIDAANEKTERDNREQRLREHWKFNHIRGRSIVVQH